MAEGRAEGIKDRLLVLGFDSWCSLGAVALISQSGKRRRDWARRSCTKYAGHSFSCARECLGLPVRSPQAPPGILLCDCSDEGGKELRSRIQRCQEAPTLHQQPELPY